MITKLLQKIYNQKILFSVIIIFLTVIFLSACIEEDPPNINEPPDNNIIDNSFFDLSYLNYNSEYNNPDDENEKGFIIYDSIDFNCVNFNHNYKRSPRFEIYYNDKHIKTIEKHPDATQFSTYTFRKTGEYTIKVLAYPGTGQTSQGEFKVNVDAGGYPDRVETEIRDFEGNKVEQVLAGKQYKLIAKVYTGDELLLEDNAKYWSKWSNGEKGARECIITIPNQRKDNVINYGFYYTCNIRSYTQTENITLEIQVKNNYSGIKMDFGPYLNAKNVAIDVTQLFVGDSSQNLKTNFMDYVKAWHCYNNGDKDPIQINTDLTNEDNTVSAFIKYNGDKEPHKYRKHLYKFDAINYFDNGTVYQLDPRKDTAELYFAYCYIEDFAGGSRYAYQDIENSLINIDLIKNTPNRISVDSIKGKEKANDSNTTFPEFVRQVTNNKVDVMIQVKKDVFPADYNKQYFTLNITMDEEATSRDYTISVDSDYLSFNYRTGEFVPKKEGQTEITIGSFIGETRYSLIVNILNPVEYVLVKTKKIGEEIPNFFIANFNFLPYLEIKEKYYNNTEISRKQLKENETYRYFDAQNKELKQEDFVCCQKEYANIQIEMINTKEEYCSRNKISVSFYVLPDVVFEIKDKAYSLSEIENWKYYKENNCYGYIPELQIEADDFSEEDIKIIGDADGHPFDQDNCKVKVTGLPFTKSYEIIYMIQDYEFTLASITIKR